MVAPKHFGQTFELLKSQEVKTRKKPLYVSFPDAEVATASQAPAKQIWTCIVCFIVFNLFEFQQARMVKQQFQED